MIDPVISPLTFQDFNYGKLETPWDLRFLLYKFGSSLPRKGLVEKIESGLLGSPQLCRLPLIAKIHQYLQGDLNGGGSRFSITKKLYAVRSFMAWVDATNQPLTFLTVEGLFIDWTEHLISLERSKQISAGHVFEMGTTTAVLFDNILDLKVGLYRRTRLRGYRRKKRVLGSQSDKENLSSTFEFGYFLVDICDSLSVDAFSEPLPIQLTLRDGRKLEEWGRFKRPESLRYLNDTGCPRRKFLINRRTEQQKSAFSRGPLFTLRVEAELLIFIAQTGMNLAQAHRLSISNFSYQSIGDGYLVRRIYKNRRQGEVEFQIFSEYRSFFDRYLKWRQKFFAESDLLFPLDTSRGRSSEVATHFAAVQRKCIQAGITFIGARQLRQTRLNWLLRISKNPQFTAEIGQHSVATLLRSYATPHHQLAAIEISRFHSATEASIIPPGPGLCVEATPVPIYVPAIDAPVPDCVSPAGCIFCSHHRDIDSFDHVWSLISYKHLKLLELASYQSNSESALNHPLKVVDRLTLKIEAIKALDESHSAWITEANERVKEGYFHTKWDGFIQIMEAVT